MTTATSRTFRPARILASQSTNTTTFTASAINCCCGAAVASATKLSRRTSAPCASFACTLAAPPGCPVFHALSMLNASAPRTSPTTILVGFNRMQALRQSSIDTRPTASSATEFFPLLYRGADHFQVALSAHRLQKVIPTTLEVQRIALVRENSVDLVLVQSEYAMRPLPNGKYRMPYHWRDQTLEAASIRGQLCFENGVVVIDDRIANRGDRAERTQVLCGGHFANNPKVLASPLDPHMPIGIQQDV